MWCRWNAHICAIEKDTFPVCFRVGTAICTPAPRGHTTLLAHTIPIVAAF